MIYDTPYMRVPVRSSAWSTAFAMAAEAGNVRLPSIAVSEESSFAGVGSISIAAGSAVALGEPLVAPVDSLHGQLYEFALCGDVPSGLELLGGFFYVDDGVTLTTDAAGVAFTHFRPVVARDRPQSRCLALRSDLDADNFQPVAGVLVRNGTSGAIELDNNVSFYSRRLEQPLKYRNPLVS